jgi:ABC-2 type transport system permease protein
MTGFLAIYLRELRASFTSMVAWAVIAVLFLYASFFFYAGCVQTQVADLTEVFGNLALAFFLVCPILTMRLLAEERKTGTLELLVTSPLTSTQIALGKYAAALTVLAAFLALSLLFPIYLAIRGGVPVAELAVQYLGAGLLGASVLGIGLVASALSENQLVAALGGLGVSLGLFFLNWIAPSFSGGARLFIDEISMISHYYSFMQGILDLRDVLYFLLWIFLSIFLAQKLIESRRWSR